MKDKLALKKNPTTNDFQKYVAEMVRQRGFEGQPISETFMLFLEECGEFSKATRKSQNMKTDKNSENFNVADEAADVFIYLLSLCNKLGVNLEDAFRKKEEKNKLRIWE